MLASVINFKGFIMKLSTLNAKLNLLAVGSNAKTIKSDDEEYLTAILYLAPSTNSRI